MLDGQKFKLLSLQVLLFLGFNLVLGWLLLLTVLDQAIALLEDLVNLIIFVRVVEEG